MTTDQNITREQAGTTSEDPDAMRRDIDRTRNELGRDVDTLTDKINPSKVVGRRVGRVKGAVGSVRERVMGSRSSTGSSYVSSYGYGSSEGAHGRTQGIGGTAGSMTSSVSDSAGSALESTRRKAEGNPLAAGLIAFGVGWLASSLLPATEKERAAATTVKEAAQEHSDTLAAPLKDAAGSAAEELAGSAKEAAEAVKTTATDAASTVQEKATPR